MAHAEAKTLAWLVAVCGLTTATLALNVDLQIFDTNFYGLFEATSLLAGDHPYRDFFEWGIPLHAAVSAAAQWLVGNRMVGEFVLVHWTFILAGAALSFALGCRVSGSPAASFALAVLAIAVLPDTPTFHYPKLFLYPLAVWLAWHYLDRPGPAAAAALGCATAVAFLFRHDHGVNVGLAAALAFVLARAAAPFERPWKRVASDAAVYAGSAAVLLAPWLVVVQRSEGLVDYVGARAALYDMWAGSSQHHLLLTMNPIRLLLPPPPATPQPGIVTFKWNDSVSPAQRAALEAQYGLRRVGGPDDRDRWRYDVADANALALNDLRLLVTDSEGIDWGTMAQRLSVLPTLERARVWQQHVTLLVPLALLGSAGLALLRARRLAAPAAPLVWRLLLAGVFLAVVGARLFREPSYAHLVAPLTAAMAGWFLVVRRPGDAGRRASLGDVSRVAVTVTLAALTGFTAIATFRPARVFRAEHVQAQAGTVRRLLATPPIEAYASRAELERWAGSRNGAPWQDGELRSRPEMVLRYLHDCTGAGDRLLITGTTPFDVAYLVGRPIAGGHVFWHHRWRTDPAREAVLLRLVESQSIPFAFSTGEPLLADLKAYPRIHRHFSEHYRPLPGTAGRLLVDARRRPASTFRPLGLPCFT